MKTINDLVLEVDVFSIIKERVRNEVIKDVIDAEQMNGLLMLNYGERELLKPVANNPELMVDLVAIELREKWDRLEGLLNEFDISSNGESFIKVINKDKEGMVFDGEDLNQVSSFNEDGLFSDSGRLTNNKEDREREGERLTESGSKSIGGTIKNLQMMGDLNIIKQMISDVASRLSLRIY